MWMMTKMITKPVFRVWHGTHSASAILQTASLMTHSYAGLHVRRSAVSFLFHAISAKQDSNDQRTMLAAAWMCGSRIPRRQRHAQPPACNRSRRPCKGTSM